MAPLVIASGGRRWGGQIEARALRTALVRAGVPEEAVVEELCSLSTWENAIFSAAALRRRSARRAALVTCSWHMPRALHDFRAAGVDVSPLPAETPPATWMRSKLLRAHEAISSVLDARAIRSAHALGEAAGRA